MNKNMEEKESLVTRLVRFIPAVEKPSYMQSFNTRLKWTGIALILYLVLSNIAVAGIASANYEQFRFFEIVFGSKFGSIMTLGIGPIVTAGIILQLLVGSKIINWDMSKPEHREKFQSWNKLLAVIFAFLEAVAYVLAGAIPVAGGFDTTIFVILQLAMGGIIVIFLDELVSKWGFGSGVSLFIAAGVGSQILIRILSPLAATCVAWQFDTCIPSEGNLPSGLLWNSLINLISGKISQALISLTPIISTITIFLLVVYIQSVTVDVPLAFSALRGFGRSWSLKLLYTSNIPVILVGALLANMQLIGRFGLTKNPLGFSCGLLGCFDERGNPASGLIYYLSSPGRTTGNFLLEIVTLGIIPSEIMRAVTYTIFLAVGATIFSAIWVNTSGMDAQSVAEQIESIGMQIPGYRRDPKIIKSVLDRYIPALAVLGGLFVGLLAAFADFIGALGTGTGILLTVMIIYNYYEELSAQRLEEAHPLVRKIFGE